MKRFNYFVMSLISAAAFTFTACSSSDDLNGGGSGEAKVEGFYMTMTIQTPTNTVTRTAEQKDKDLAATLAESKVNSGTFFLVDANNKIVFSKNISATGDNSDLLPSDGKNGSTTLKIKVENVVAGATYKAYFLANATEASWEEGKTFAPFTPILEAKEKFAKPAATDNAFIMFNQNDATVDGNAYTVRFTDNNKQESTPASITYDDKQENAPIKIERVTARIDEPTSTSAIAAYDESKATTEAIKRAMQDAVKKVDNIKLVRYALSDVANKSYIMQNWTEDSKPYILNIPDGITPWQKHDDFGTKFQFNNSIFFQAVKADEKADSHKDYVFENNSETAPTTIYFEYKVTLKADAGAHVDFTDGTFYRYNNVIYTSFEDIFKQYNDVAGLFGKKTAAELKQLLTDYKAAPTTLEANLASFRETYDIEVFNEGKTYYKQAIRDNYIGYSNAIQRNTVYQFNVSNIYNVGAQVPNGIIDEDALFYLSVNVTVNNWVLNTQDIELK